LHAGTPSPHPHALTHAAACRVSYGANVDAFLGAVTDTAGAAQGDTGRSGLGVLDSALEAVSAVKVVEALNAIRELLRAQAADVASSAGGAGLDDSRATFLNLAALLSVANGAATKKFDASEWSLTEAEAVRIARVFARHATPFHPPFPKSHPLNDNSHPHPPPLHASALPQLRWRGQPPGCHPAAPADG
jgi:hypothetical protein